MASFITIDTLNASSTFQILLEDGLFDFKVYFSTVSNLWFMDLVKDDVQIVEGLALVIGADLLLPFDPNIGAWTMIDFNNAGIDATRDTLGVAVGLLYIPSSELSGEETVETIST